jgi:hypothetical protein
MTPITSHSGMLRLRQLTYRRYSLWGPSSTLTDGRKPTPSRCSLVGFGDEACFGYIGFDGSEAEIEAVDAGPAGGFEEAVEIDDGLRGDGEDGGCGGSPLSGWLWVRSGAVLCGVGFHQPNSLVLPPRRRTPWGERERNWAMRLLLAGEKKVGSSSCMTS